MTDQRNYQQIAVPYDITPSLQSAFNELNRILIDIQMSIAKTQGLDDFTPEFVTSPEISVDGTEDQHAVRKDQLSEVALEGLLGTSNQITVTDNGDGTYTLSFPGTTRFGSAANITAGNYAEFEADGTLVFNGDATVWDDFVVELTSAKIPASNAPNWAQVTNDGSGSTGVFAWHFDDGEYIEFHIQMPHRWKEGTTIYPHMHFECTSDVSPTDKFGIEIEYFWVDINEDRPANSTLASLEIETGVNTDTMHQVANLSAAGISGAGHTISSILICRLERVAASADNYADQIIIYDIDVHYEVDTLGSRGTTTK